MIRSLIIKCIRACNLRCRYCYYINDQTPEYGLIITEQTIERLYQKYSAYIPNGMQSTFAWHGGEPLMLGMERFQRFIDLQKKYFPPDTIKNVVQSNGVLVNKDWISFFKRNNISVGISIGGTRENHDQKRITVSNKGTFVRSVKAFQELMRHGIDVGVLSVVNGGFDGGDTVKFFWNIGVKSLDFLLPVTNHSIQRLGNNGEGIDIKKTGQFLNHAFEKWVELDDAAFNVRLFEALILNAFGVKTQFQYTGPTGDELLEYVIVETDGAVCMDEEYGQIDRYGLGNENKLGLNILENDFSFNKAERKLRSIIDARRLGEAPDKCKSCDVYTMCRGSHPGTRFDADTNSYNNPGVYCEVMYDLCELILKHITDNNMEAHIKDPVLRSKAIKVASPKL